MGRKGIKNPVMIKFCKYFIEGLLGLSRFNKFNFQVSKTGEKRARNENGKEYVLQVKSPA
jgi:hypothetical protein